MLSDAQLSQLLAPVVCRAQARGEASIAGFIDRAAGYVLTLLECSPEVSSHSSKQRHALRRYQWLDEEALIFFEAHPEGVGIEVAGGLSTRFHRLCEQLDWPRFSWRAVNTPNVDDCISFIFPELDNHMHAACHDPLINFHKVVHWGEVKSKLIIAGEDKPISGVSQLQKVIRSIQNKLTDQTPEVTLLVGYIGGDVGALYDGIAGVQLVSEMPRERSDALWARFISQYWPAYQKPVCAYKFVISRVFEA